MRGERPGHTLQATALVNEIYLRLDGLDRMQWRDRSHFLATAATLMRRILVDHARKRKREKRVPPSRSRRSMTSIRTSGWARATSTWSPSMKR
jgi:hypothetical protein